MSDYEVPIEYANAVSVAELLGVALAHRGWTHTQLHTELSAAMLRGGDQPPSRTLVWQWLQGTRGIASDHLQAVGKVLGWNPAVQLVAARIAGQRRAAQRSRASRPGRV